MLKQLNPDIPVFTVQKENGEGRKRTLHRNLLLPIGALHQSERPTQAPRSRIPRQRSGRVPAVEETQETLHREHGLSDTESELETEDGYVPVIIERSEQVTPSVTNTDTSGESIDSSSESEEQEAVTEDELQINDPTEDAQLSTIEERSEIEEVQVENPLYVEETETPPRSTRPTRIRKPPSWVTSGQYVMAMPAKEPEWMTRVQYLKDLLRGDWSDGMKDKIMNSMLAVVSDV